MIKTTSPAQECLQPVSKSCSLPHDMKLPDHQVAGHCWGNKKTGIGFLQHTDGSLLKAIQSAPRGEREMKFYQKVFSPACTNPVLLSLRPFMPMYVGEYYSPHLDVHFFKMENITQHMRNPCIMDLKMGVRTWDPEASQAKRTREEGKYPLVTETGFQLIGMKVYNKQTDESNLWDKKYGRSLSVDELMHDKGLGLYVSAMGTHRNTIINGFIHRLRKLEEWIMGQVDFNFFACSLLLAYEGEPHHSQSIIKDHKRPKIIESANQDPHNITPIISPNQDQHNMRPIKLLKHIILDSRLETKSGKKEPVLFQSSNQNEQSLSLVQKLKIPNLKRDVNGYNAKNLEASKAISSNTDDVFRPKYDIRLIDFTHVFNLNQRDDNFLFGLRKLMTYLEALKH